MHWLLEPEVFQEDSDFFIQALKNLKVDHTLCKFGKSYESYINDMKHSSKIMFHGSLQFGKKIKEAKSNITVFCDLPKFECLYYYSFFGKELLNQNYLMLPFGELKRRKDWVFSTLQQKESVFLRPSSGYKTFTGTIVDLDEWESAIKFYGFKINPEELVVVAPPVTILKEWRFVIVEGEVITGSQYKEDGEMVRELECPQEVFNYAQQVVDFANYKPEPAWTLDVAETENGYKVIEVGSFSCAGLYVCDYEKVIKRINKLMEKS